MGMGLSKRQKTDADLPISQVQDPSALPLRSKLRKNKSHTSVTLSLTKRRQEPSWTSRRADRGRRRRRDESARKGLIPKRLTRSDERVGGAEKGEAGAWTAWMLLGCDRETLAWRSRIDR